MASNNTVLTIDTLLNLVPDRPAAILSYLSSHPTLASRQDSHGYSLIHAAASYAQLDLLRALVRTYNAPVDLRDEDDETPLFAAEAVDVARVLIEELGADPGARNAEGQTARQKMEDEGETADVAAYLRGNEGAVVAADAALDQSGSSLEDATAASAGAPENADVHPPPPLPANVSISVGTMEPLPDEGPDAPDPAFRARIEELAARDDFATEEGQRRLRELVTEAVVGLEAEAGRGDAGGRDATRRRVG
ncbi:hypothetical protein BDY21DRAFT_360928 [Lineolata rhizophorae]|uniref:Uncharacterized protein n=1 Tax=Lineolata rhizophorae TaxID=578093 RepID=A0A6A6PAH9_9PEZI|nr:hypothetical protein BDY21DRAFT_360928 [Lineolata rhizophorae]